MADILEYITWRGDLDFELVPLNEVDALILCQLSYLDFGGSVGDGFSAGVTVREAADRFFAAEDSSRRSDVGALINFKTVELLKAAGKSVRFGSLLMCGYGAQTDEVEELQFAAVTFVCGKLRRPRWSFVAYRGTDDTIVGWKEDFNLGYKDTVPAQRSAAAYLAGAARNLKGALYAGGHSKGGNLALFAAACAKRACSAACFPCSTTTVPASAILFLPAQATVRWKTGCRPLFPASLWSACSFRTRNTLRPWSAGKRTCSCSMTPSAGLYVQTALRNAAGWGSGAALWAKR